MSTLLVSSDPYSILHACIWDQPEKESTFIKSETIDVPTEHDLADFRPYTYNILDSGPNPCVFPDDRSKIIVRDEYPSLWSIIEEDRYSPGREFGGMVVTGHPGIGNNLFWKHHLVLKSTVASGKSFFIYYYLVKSLLAGNQTALQTDKSSFFLFTNQGVHLVRFSSDTPIHDTQSHLKTLNCKKGLVALVDANEENPSPASVFTDSRFPFYIIHATSPRPARWRDWVEQRSAAVLVMRPWSWSEIFIGGTKFTKRSLSAKDLFEVFERYGPSPRVCFDLAGDERRIASYNRNLRREISECPSFDKAIEMYGLSDMLTTPSYSIFLMVPDASRLPLTTFVSKYVGLLVEERTSIKYICRQAELNAETRPMGEYLYRTKIHRSLTSGMGHECFSLEDDYSGLAYGWSPSPPTQHCSIASIENPASKTYYIVNNHATATYHSFIIDKWGRMVLFKATISRDSPISIAELDELADRLPTQLLPRDNYCWHLVFVVPGYTKAEFGVQPYVGTGKREWRTDGLVYQYYMDI